MIDLADSRQFGLHCKECGSRKVVYFISFPLDAFEPGAYCYTCLLQRCRQSRMIPFPIDETLLNSLKRDMGLTESTPPVYIQGKPFYGGKK
ncbi:hypothetical protein KKF61_07015 [Patescibacteria group bacterium]|nr:hypothetical protein [Patescibacteria group bacterium]